MLLPPIRASGFLGRRVDERREGITPMMFTICPASSPAW
jgi:hypothetical protein